MKPIVCLIAALLVLALAACAPVQQPQTAPQPEPQAQPAPEPEPLTAEAVTELFRKKADPDCTVQDCVAVNDGAYGLVGVVQYGQEDGYTHFAFVGPDGFFQTVGVGALPAEESKLEYLGNAAVSALLFDSEKGVASCYRVEYSNDGAGSPHFVVSAEAVG